jgi:transcriptional regulator with XRE-family HTH domain
MPTQERDPEFIAKQVKFIRKFFGFTQENLADAAGLTTRTIEKIESGRHYPEAQTLRSLARATKLDVRYFEKPTAEEEARQQAEMERALRKTVVLPTNPARSTSDFLAIFNAVHAFRCDISQVQNDKDLDLAASLKDWIDDLILDWQDCTMSDRIESARAVLELCAQLEALGYVCHMGHYRQVLRGKGKPDLVVPVGLLSIQNKSTADGTRYALIELEGMWETENAADCNLSIEN